MFKKNKNLENQEKKPHTKFKDLTKEQKKKRVRKCIAIAVAALILVMIIVSRIAAANAKTPVMVTEVALGDVEAILSASGTVESQNTKTYYSDMNATIGKVAVKAGQAVAKGDVLLSFDENSLQIAKADAQANALTSEGTYKDTMNQNAKTAAKLKESNINLDVLEQQITDYKAFVKDQERKLEDIKNKRQAELASESLVNSEAFYNGEKSMDDYNKTEAEISYLRSTMDISKDVVDIQHTIDDAKETLQNLEEYKSEMKSQKSATEDNVMSGTTAEAKKVSNEATQLTNEKILNYAEAVSGGLKADFSGVVTEVQVVEGAPVTAGGALVTVASNEDVVVIINLSKNDLKKAKVGQKADVIIAGKTYEGELSAINHMATKNSNNNTIITAEVTLKNGDSDVYLGIEAKVKIHADRSEGTLIVPVQTVNTDQAGDFVYAVEDGVIVRKEVETGVSSDEYVEILKGVSKGDQVVTEITTNLVEGLPVNPVVDAGVDMTTEETTQVSTQAATEEANNE